MKSLLKKIPIFKYLVIFFRIFSIKPNFLKRLRMFVYFLSDYYYFKKKETNKTYRVKTENLFPRIYDKTTSTNVDPIYFLQGTWCAEKIFKQKPTKHYDVGSQAIMVGIISKFVPTTMIDIRPLSISLPELSFIKGSVTDLPFKDNEISSLSSICVIEHIGLGRYGDQLDQFGSEKAAKELTRVLSPGGNLYISVPIDKENNVYFNAHRAFTRDYVLELFKPLKLIEEKYIYGNNLTNEYSPNSGFGTGLYNFKK